MQAGTVLALHTGAAQCPLGGLWDLRERPCGPPAPEASSVVGQSIGHGPSAKDRAASGPRAHKHARTPHSGLLRGAGGRWETVDTAGVMGCRDAYRSGVHMLPHVVGIRKPLQAVFTHFPQAPQKCPGVEGTDGGEPWGREGQHSSGPTLSHFQCPRVGSLSRAVLSCLPSPAQGHSEGRIGSHSWCRAPGSGPPYQ